MSRAVFSNAQYTFAFGVDHTPMGTFIQIWDKKAPMTDEEEESSDPHFEYDAMYGPRRQKGYTASDNGLLFRMMIHIAKEWDYNKEKGRTNLGVQHIVQFACALNFDKQTIDVIQRKAFELWD